MFNFDQRSLYIVLAIIILVNFVSMGTGGLVSLILTLPGVIIAMAFHEFAHAWMAVKLGDDTPLAQGRVSLNPLSHIDPMGIMMLLFCGVGWGKPVQIDTSNFNGKYRKNGEALVALAGPLMNFILAFVFTFILGIIMKFAGLSFIGSTVGTVILTMIEYAVIMNIGLGVFNLIPLPPLDGSKIFIRFMPYNVRNWIYDHEMWFYMLFLIIWFTDISSLIISPIMNWIYSFIMNAVGMLLGLM